MAWSSHERTREWKRTKEASSACQAKFSAVTPELCSDEIWKRQTIAAEEEHIFPSGSNLRSSLRPISPLFLGRLEVSFVACFMSKAATENWKAETGREVRDEVRPRKKVEKLAEKWREEQVESTDLGGERDGRGKKR